MAAAALAHRGVPPSGLHLPQPTLGTGYPPLSEAHQPDLWSLPSPQLRCRPPLAPPPVASTVNSSVRPSTAQIDLPTSFLTVHRTFPAQSCRSTHAGAPPPPSHTAAAAIVTPTSRLRPPQAPPRTPRGSSRRPHPPPHRALAAGEPPRRETAAPPSLSPPLFSNPAKGIYARPQIFLGGFLQIPGNHLQYLDLFSNFYGEFVNSIKNHRKILK